MKAQDLFSSNKNFLSEKEIKHHIAKSKNFQKSLENPRNADILLLFKTSKQQTWLVATQRRLYCILDDVRKKTPKIVWSKGKSQLVASHDLSIQLKTHDYSRLTGLVDFGDDRRDWLYTKSLFDDVESSITDLISKKML